MGYRAVEWLGLKGERDQEIGVRMMQIGLALLCDWYLLKIADIYLPGVGGGWLLIMTTNWYYFSMLNRTYSNSAETALTIAAFYFWLIRGHRTRYDYISRLLVILCFTIRPTSIIPWAVIWPFELIRHTSKLTFIMKNAVTM